MPLPKIKDLYSNLPLIQKNDEFQLLMNQEPPKEWVKVHPYIKNHRYIPIERVEFLLKTIFKSYRIEITNQGTAFNGVWVTVKLHYIHPITGEWEYHDGIGACQLQTKKDSSPADLANINNGALAMAFPIAKTAAIKDAADHFGKLFGSDLNRKDFISYKQDLTLLMLDENHPNWLKALSVIASQKFTVEEIKESYSMTEEVENYLTEVYNGTIKIDENGNTIV